MCFGPCVIAGTSSRSGTTTQIRERFYTKKIQKPLLKHTHAEDSGRDVPRFARYLRRADGGKVYQAMRQQQLPSFKWSADSFSGDVTHSAFLPAVEWTGRIKHCTFTAQLVQQTPFWRFLCFKAAEVRLIFCFFAVGMSGNKLTRPRKKRRLCVLSSNIHIGLPETSSRWRCVFFPLRCHATTTAEEGAVRKEALDNGGVDLLFLFCFVWWPDSRSVVVSSLPTPRRRRRLPPYRPRWKEDAAVTFKSPAFWRSSFILFLLLMRQTCLSLGDI